MEYTPALRPPPARAAGRLLGTGAALAAFAAALSLLLYRRVRYGEGAPLRSPAAAMR